MELFTKTLLEENGTHIEINGGEIIQFQNTACTEGTSLIIRNLFYNVPARRKFLKKPSTEASYISELLNQFALGHPDIALSISTIKQQYCILLETMTKKQQYFMYMEKTQRKK